MASVLFLPFLGKYAEAGVSGLENCMDGDLVPRGVCKLDGTPCELDPEKWEKLVADAGIDIGRGEPKLAPHI